MKVIKIILLCGTCLSIYIGIVFLRNAVNIISGNTVILAGDDSPAGIGTAVLFFVGVMVLFATAVYLFISAISNSKAEE